MCREGAWIELTVTVTMPMGIRRRTCDFYFGGKVTFLRTVCSRSAKTFTIRKTFSEAAALKATADYFLKELY